jgi:tagaturonate reductase
MTKRIIQFGTSRFLQAHVDLFVHEARLGGQDIGPITVVKTTKGSERAGRVAAFRRPGGFPVRIQGYRGGTTVDETIQVMSVDSALDADTDWSQLVDLFVGEADFVVSNVGDRGYEIGDADRARPPAAARAAASFPAKLLQLLLARHAAGGRPLTILPCELVPANGAILRRHVETLAAAWKARDGFGQWLKESVVFTDTLVDRIVSAAIEPVGAVAEPYALWAIRGEAAPFAHPAIVVTPDLEPIERLKLHILNLGHTWLAETWMKEKRPERETVKEILADPSVRKRLDALYAEEVVPGFAARAMESEATGYIDVTFERFLNPFLEHRIADIAQNHAVKVERRIGAFIEWARGANASLQMPRLAALVAAYA